MQNNVPLAFRRPSAQGTEELAAGNGTMLEAPKARSSAVPAAFKTAAFQKKTRGASTLLEFPSAPSSVPAAFMGMRSSMAMAQGQGGGGMSQLEVAMLAAQQTFSVPDAAQQSLTLADGSLAPPNMLDAHSFAIWQQMAAAQMAGMNGAGVSSFGDFPIDGADEFTMGMGFTLAPGTIGAPVVPEPLIHVPSSSSSSSGPGGKGKGRWGHKSEAQRHQYSLRMRNLPQGISQEEIFAAYREKGVTTIQDIYLPGGKPFGFLRFMTSTQGQAVIGTKIILCGVTIDLEVATGSKRGPEEWPAETEEERVARELQDRWKQQLQHEQLEKQVKDEREKQYMQELMRMQQDSGKRQKLGPQ